MREEALLTDEEILAIYQNRNWRIFEPDLIRAQVIAQEQLGKVLQADGIEIRSKDQSLPKTSGGLSSDGQELYGGIMLKAGFVKVIPKGR